MNRGKENDSNSIVPDRSRVIKGTSIRGKSILGRIVADALTVAKKDSRPKFTAITTGGPGGFNPIEYFLKVELWHTRNIRLIRIENADELFHAAESEDFDLIMISLFCVPYKDGERRRFTPTVKELQSLKIKYGKTIVVLAWPEWAVHFENSGIPCFTGRIGEDWLGAIGPSLEIQ
jgi:hypothetical protein